MPTIMSESFRPLQAGSDSTPSRQQRVGRGHRAVSITPPPPVPTSPQRSTSLGPFVISNSSLLNDSKSNNKTSGGGNRNDTKNGSSNMTSKISPQTSPNRRAMQGYRSSLVDYTKQGRQDMPSRPNRQSKSPARRTAAFSTPSQTLTRSPVSGGYTSQRAKSTDFGSSRTCSTTSTTTTTTTDSKDSINDGKNETDDGDDNETNVEVVSFMFKRTSTMGRRKSTQTREELLKECCRLASLELNGSSEGSAEYRLNHSSGRSTISRQQRRSSGMSVVQAIQAAGGGGGVHKHLSNSPQSAERRQRMPRRGSTSVIENVLKGPTRNSLSPVRNRRVSAQHVRGGMRSTAGRLVPSS